jgi:hypothetical protein
MQHKDFIIYSDTGEILRTGRCPEDAFSLQAQPGEHIIEGTACCVKDSIDPETGAIIECGRPVAQQTEPPALPQPAGLSTATQLDLLWQAMDAGTFPKAEPFYSAVKAEKEAAA